MVKRVRSVFDIRKRNKGRLFVVLIFFLVSFSIARLYSLYINVYVYIDGYHIHHFYYGTLALAMGGILGILNDSNNKKRIFIASALIGIGMGLFADEIGLLLNCTTGKGFSAYTFPDVDDIILTIAGVIIFLIAIVDTDIQALREKFSYLRLRRKRKLGKSSNSSKGAATRQTSVSDGFPLLHSKKRERFSTTQEQ